MNPSDLLSRGSSPRQLLECKWLEGSEWLLRDSETWPVTELNCETKDLDCERRKVMAWVLRFLENWRSGSKNLEELSTTEIEKSEFADVSGSATLPKDTPDIDMVKVSRYGRSLRKPKRLDLLNLSTVFGSS
ncbi:hypothetical protein AVEN_151918-1 [Araneus ventricosus]|uniref:Uncharacterized protein n=1 Tax=Araneus ventricosus TaxID=182803 RepID=A0A4Y2JI95_ARAVE|nr:hypothetical protein AVEN_151918-1 [Araneus ventricosus]